MLARENSLLANEAGENNESYTNRQNIWQGNEADNEILRTYHGHGFKVFLCG